MVRGLAPGERLTFSHLEAMGQYRAEWFQQVAGNNRESGWTKKNIQHQLVLINTISKSKLLFRALGK